MRKVKTDIMMYILYILLVHLLDIIWACKTAGWRNMSFEELMFRSDVVVYGKDIDHGKFRLPTFVDARFDIYCVFKKGANIVPGQVIIENIYDGEDCSGVKGQTVEGQEYILGLKREISGFMSYANINPLQKTAFPPTQDNLNILASICGLDHWTPPASGNQSRCPPADKPRWCTKVQDPTAGGNSVLRDSCLLFYGLLIFHVYTWICHCFKLWCMTYRKDPKYLDTRKDCCSSPQICKTLLFYLE